MNQTCCLAQLRDQMALLEPAQAADGGMGQDYDGANTQFAFVNSIALFGTHGGDERQ